MNTGQLDFFQILDGFSGSVGPWCKSWHCARKNDVGVFVENVRTFRQGNGLLEYVELKCGLFQSRVYFACSVQDRTAGRGSPLVEDGDCSFGVDVPIEQAEASVRGYLQRCASGYKVKSRWIEDVVKNFKKALLE